MGGRLAFIEEFCKSALREAFFTKKGGVLGGNSDEMPSLKGRVVMSQTKVLSWEFEGLIPVKKRNFLPSPVPFVRGRDRHRS